MTLLTPALRDRIGETAVYVSPEAIGHAAVRYFAAAVGDNPLYHRPVGPTGPIVPPTLIFETNAYADRRADDDGYPGHSWHLDVPGTRLVRGGHEYHWTRDVRAEDVITAMWRLEDMSERTTRAGAAMLLVTSACQYSASDEPVAEQTEHLVYVALS